jgi:hypothetical protein
MVPKSRIYQRSTLLNYHQFEKHQTIREIDYKATNPKNSFGIVQSGWCGVWRDAPQLNSQDWALKTNS